MAKSKQDLIRFANHEIIGEGNLDIVEEVFAADYQVHYGGSVGKGTGFVRRWTRQIRTALPNVKVVQVEVLMQAGSTIAWQRTMSGNHNATLRGIPPSGKQVTWRDMLVTRFDGKLIVEEWAVSDLAGQLMLKLPAS